MFFLNKNHFFLPVILASFIIFIFGFYYWDMLPMGTIHKYDEYKTLDRVNAFFLKDDWLTVYTDNKPNFKKPPLQYWITAIAVTESGDLEFALRICSYIFGLGLLIATGLLAYTIIPSSPYAIPAAILILTGSSMLWRSTISAMLDAGAAFFFVVTVAAFTLAIRHPRWWYLVAISTGLGTLQKAPVGLMAVCGIFVLIHTTRRFHDVNLQEIFGNKHFRISAWLTALLVLSWPVLQIARYGIEVIYLAYIKEIVLRLAPVDVIGVAKEQWWQWLIRDGAGLWIPAILSLFMLPYFFRKPESWVPLFLFCCFAILMTLAIGSIYPRYVLLVLPILAASLASLLARIIPVRVFAAVIACVLTLSAGDPFKNPDSLSLFESSQNKFKPLFQNFAKSLGEEEMPLLCVWSKTKSTKIHPEAFSYFASNGKVFLELHNAEELSMKERLMEIAPPYRGLCKVDEFEELKKQLGSYGIIEQSNGYIHWTGTGTVSPDKK